jgi:hypothetical protein
MGPNFFGKMDKRWLSSDPSNQARSVEQVNLPHQKRAVQAAEWVAIASQFVERMGLDLVAALLGELCNG